MKQELLAACLALLSHSAIAQAAVKTDDAWVRGTVERQTATGAFMRLTPQQDLRLVAARSPVAGVVELHEMALEDNIMKMRQIPGLDLAAGRTMDLKPGGYHVMLMSLKARIKGGDRVPITLVFEDAAGKQFTQDVVAPATALGGGNAAPSAARP